MSTPHEETTSPIRGTSPVQESPCHDDDPDAVMRRMTQREKQIQFGYNTEGHANMMRLIKSDPRLCNGGVLPLEPPSADMRSSKRNWDMLIRKWRRALHMFDHIFIDGEDDEKTTLNNIVELQRQQWVSSTYTERPKIKRIRIRSEDIHAARASDCVPQRLPVEEALVPLLRSRAHWDPVYTLCPETQYGSPQNSGIKILIAPVNPLGAGESPIQSRSPSPPTLPRYATASSEVRVGGTSPFGKMRFGGSSPLPPAFDMTPTPSNKREAFGCFRDDGRSPSPERRGVHGRSPKNLSAPRGRGAGTSPTAPRGGGLSSRFA